MGGWNGSLDLTGYHHDCGEGLTLIAVMYGGDVRWRQWRGFSDSEAGSDSASFMLARFLFGGSSGVEQWNLGVELCVDCVVH
jgi:hypothetical protein